MNKISRRKFLKYFTASLITLGLLDIFWFEKYIIDWNYFTLRNPNTNHKPLKIIQLSDLHLTSLKSFHKSIAKKIIQIKPDVLMITGDAIDDKNNLLVLDSFLKLIDHSIIKYAITGNWEYWGKINLDELKNLYNSHNCKLLINQNDVVEIKNRRLGIIGVDDYIGGNANFSKSIEKLPETDTNIVLTHCPVHRDIIHKENSKIKIDLVLSGHTHGGQINLFGYVPFKPRGSGKYLKGWYDKEGPKMYVSKGIGTSIFPARLLARAEVTQFEI